MEGNRRWEEIRDLFLAKEKRRRELAGLSIERKIQILIRMQRLAQRLPRHASGLRRRSWDIKKRV